MDAPDGDYRYITARGWPFRALWSRIRWLDREEVIGTGILGGIYIEHHEIPRWVNMPMDSTVLPCLIVVPGFVADTALYAGLWWTILLVPGAACRVLRRREGLCPPCGYDLRTLRDDSPCPECGAAIAAELARTGP